VAAGPGGAEGIGRGEAAGPRRGRQVEARPAQPDRRREQHPGQGVRGPTEAAGPLPDGRLGAPEGRRDRAHAAPGDVELEGVADDVDGVPAVRGHEPGQQGRRSPAAPTAHPGDEDAMQADSVAQVTQVASPGPGRSAAARAGHPRRRNVTPLCRVCADIEPAGPYDHRRWTFAPPRPSERQTSLGGSPDCVGSDHRRCASPRVTVPIKRGRHRRVHPHTDMPPTAVPGVGPRSGAHMGRHIGPSSISRLPRPGRTDNLIPCSPPRARGTSTRQDTHGRAATSSPAAPR